MSPWPYKTQWPYKTLTGPIATSEIMIHYALSKLTKRSDKLFLCFHTSHILSLIFCLSFNLSYFSSV